MHDFSWVFWAAVGIMILLQLIILVMIAGRPSAIAIIGVTLPALCGVCGLVATWLILDYIHSPSQGSPELARYTGNLVGLMYMIWVICGVVALTAVVLSVVLLRRGIAVPAPTAPAASPSSVDEPDLTRADEAREVKP